MVSSADEGMTVLAHEAKMKITKLTEKLTTELQKSDITREALSMLSRNGKNASELSTTPLSCDSHCDFSAYAQHFQVLNTLHSAAHLIAINKC